jgi:hypothetical protein
LAKDFGFIFDLTGGVGGGGLVGSIPVAIKDDFL